MKFFFTATADPSPNYSSNHSSLTNVLIGRHTNEASSNQLNIASRSGSFSNIFIPKLIKLNIYDFLHYS